MDYGKSGAPKRKTKEPRNPYGKTAKAPDKGELLARMKAAAAKAKADDDQQPKG